MKVKTVCAKVADAHNRCRSLSKHLWVVPALKDRSNITGRDVWEVMGSEMWPLYQWWETVDWVITPRLAGHLVDVVATWEPDGTMRREFT